MYMNKTVVYNQESSIHQYHYSIHHEYNDESQV